MEDAIRYLVNGKSARHYNIPAELLEAGDGTVDILHKICDTI